MRGGSHLIKLSKQEVAGQSKSLCLQASLSLLARLMELCSLQQWGYKRCVSPKRKSWVCTMSSAACPEFPLFLSLLSPTVTPVRG